MNQSFTSTKIGIDKSTQSLPRRSEIVEGSHVKLSEEEIWRQFKSGDEQAFIHIYESYFSVLFNYGHRFCKDRHIVKDHIQDMFIDLRKSKKRLSDTTSIKFYLFSTIRRRIIRAESKKSFLVNTDDYQNYDFEITLSPEQKMINSQMNDNIKKVLIENINKLSGRQKEAIIYYYYEGFSYEQVSQLMDFSKVKYARILIYRAVKKLKDNIRTSELISFFALLILSLKNIF